jgi:hypothetical protein
MSPRKPGKSNSYARLLEAIFAAAYRDGATVVEFAREDIVTTAERLGIRIPKNLGDVIYTFRYRADYPEAIKARAPEGKVWTIEGIGNARYAFVATSPGSATILPNPHLVETRIPNATPGVIELYALSDEQALLAKLRYNRLLDIFTGASCYSLQSHLRTKIKSIGQVETDEVYVGIDKRGAHFVFPVQAKGGRDSINIVQIKQDLAMCEARFPNATCRAIAAQFMEENLIAMFEFIETQQGVGLASEKHYRLVPPKSMTPEEIRDYGQRPE